MSSKYPYIGESSLYGAWAVFYGKDNGILLSSGSSWLKVGCKVKENGFRFVDQTK
ncbi:hypothetical protein K6Y31_20625 [Motilimonas cestriensis]|uniref:Uncharacterized protein n=1 Tax=Motilimonas cestriensis TaxID=2742685 RepID=A0ABS8WFR2_9GAMM|nr:hypothetical protein [Motilimonas cestriensis]MCE2597182.1 hypothetical protein [Motilimonas cestriensis]